MSEQKFISEKNLTNINSVQGNVILNTYHYHGLENPASSSPDSRNNETDRNRPARHVSINREFAESEESEKSVINSVCKKRGLIALIFALCLTITVFKWTEENTPKDGLFSASSNLSQTNVYQEASPDTPKNVAITRNSSRTTELTGDKIEEITVTPQSTITYTYETTSWSVDKNELTIMYRDSDNSTYTTKFKLEKSSGDLRYIIRRLPADTKINVPDGWRLDTVRSTVTINDVSKTQSLGSDAVIISGPNTVITKTHDVQFTARYLGIAIEHYATTDWSEHNGILTVSYEGSDGSRRLTETLTFNKKSSGGDNYYVISSGLPAHTRINLPKGWTLDTVKNAVDVTDQSKIMPIDKIAINIAGENVVVTKYSNVPFTARHSD